MRKMAHKKLNNQGSTFVLALIIITLVTALALAIMAASINNINMKNIDRNSKNTFYTAESVLDEIRAGVGLDAMNRLGEAYELVLTNVIRTNDAGYSYAIDNITANKEFKGAFVDYMLRSMTGGSLVLNEDEDERITDDINVKGKVKEYLQGYIKGYDAGLASISSIGNIEAYKESSTGITWVIIIRDVVVSYIEEKAGEEYFAYVTSDLEIEFPNMVVDFSNSNRINDFTEYALIADRNLEVTGVDATSEASIYAGNQIRVDANGYASGHFTVASPLANTNVKIVCGGDAGVASGTIIASGNADVKSYLDISGADIWCTNIVTGTYMEGGIDYTKGAEINIYGTCNSYVKDDLSLEGKESKIDLQGYYYGYSYDGNDDLLSHLASSAIIVNGQNANLNIGVTRMMLGGHAYVDLTLGAEDYMTGEAISFKGDQEIYLVPSQYLAKNYGVSVPNPMPIDTWNELKAKAEEAGSNVIICDTTGFFANTRGYLSVAQYTPRIVGNVVYLYLDFASKDAAASYVRDIVNGADGELKIKLDRYTENLFEGNGSVSITGTGANIYTKGALLKTDNGYNAGVHSGTGNLTAGEISYSNGGEPATYDEFILSSMDLKNRYTIFTHLLADIPWIDAQNNGKRYIVNDVDAALEEVHNYIAAGGELSSPNMFDSIIDRELVESYEYNENQQYFEYGEVGNNNYIKIATDGDYIVPFDCNGGIIVATGDVKLDHNFDGLIIAGGNIKIVGNATITTNATWVEMFIQNELPYKYSDDEEDVAFKEFFYAYKHAATDDESREEVKVETVDFKEMIKFNNWRKYEDANN